LKLARRWILYINTVTFNDVTVDIDLSVYEKSSAETMAWKLKQMSTPQKEVAISLFEDEVSQRRIADISGVSQIRCVKIFWSDSISEKVVKMNDKVVDQEKLMTAVTERFCVVWKRTDDKVWRKLRTKWIMFCQTRFLQGLFVDDYDSMGSQGEKFVRPSPFGLRTDLVAYIGVSQSINGL
jgi:hypothetical protein